MTYIIKRRIGDEDLYLACHETPWGWWQSSLSFAARFALRGAALTRLLETQQSKARIVRLRLTSQPKACARTGCIADVFENWTHCSMEHHYADQKDAERELVERLLARQ